MLRIGTLRWKGRCGRHQTYNPSEGEGGIKGGCERCYALLEIYRQHRKLVDLMRAFGPPRERAPKPDLFSSQQPSLFD